MNSLTSSTKKIAVFVFKGRHEPRQEYEFPTKRYRLKRDPNDRSPRSNGVGMRIVGGKRQLESNQLVAFVAEIYEGGVAARTDGKLISVCMCGCG